MLPDLGFPVNLGRVLESSDSNRKVLSEVDFFSSPTSKLSAHEIHQHHQDVKTLTNNNISAKKEIAQSQPISKSNLDMNVRSLFFNHIISSDLCLQIH